MDEIKGGPKKKKEGKWRKRKIFGRMRSMRRLSGWAARYHLAVVAAAAVAAAAVAWG